MSLREIGGFVLKNEIILFEEAYIKLKVNLQDETVWLTQKQIAVLFAKDRMVITKHINNILTKGKLTKSNVQKMYIANSDKPVEFYNLNMIISVGYRVKSKRGIAFIIWANKILKEYLLHSYVINKPRLDYLEKQ